MHDALTRIVRLMNNIHIDIDKSITTTQLDVMRVIDDAITHRDIDRIVTTYATHVDATYDIDAIDDAITNVFDRATASTIFNRIADVMIARLDDRQ